MEKLSEKLCELVRNLKHLHDVTLLKHGEKLFLQNIWEEIGCKLYMRVFFFSLSCPLVDALLKIHASVKDVWMYVCSDGYIA